jgi:tetratricopeptide (TPR) repeat protein
MGDAKLAQDEVVEAEKDYRESLAIRSALGQRGDIASSELSLANLKLELNQPDEVDKLARKATEEFQAEKMGDQEALARIVDAEALLIQKRVSEAEMQLEEARKLSIQDRTVMLALEIVSARSASSRTKSDEAIRQLRTVISRAKQMSLPGYEFWARFVMAETQMSSGSRDQAFETLQRLRQEAAQGGFKLIARKATEAQSRFQTRGKK